jgi:hypothetical protein
MIEFVRGAFGVSIRKACRAIPACSLKSESCWILATSSFEGFALRLTAASYSDRACFVLQPSADVQTR